MSDTNKPVEPPRVSDERLAEMLAGLQGVTPGPWFDWDNMEWIVEPKKLLSSEAATLIARCDPDTIRAILTELQSFRAPDSATALAIIERLEVAEALEQFAMIDEAEGGNPLVIATERRAAELLRAAFDMEPNSQLIQPSVTVKGEPLARAKVISALYGDGVDPGHSLGDMIDALISLARASFTPSPPIEPAGDEGTWEFDRYVNGIRMAEGVSIKNAVDFEEASRKAAQLAARGPKNERPVLVLGKPIEPAGVTVNIAAVMKLVEDYADARVDQYSDLVPPAAPPHEALDANDKAVDECRALVIAALSGDAS